MDSYEHLRDYTLGIPYASIITAIVYKTIRDVVREYRVDWFGVQKSEWHEIALITPFQYLQARKQLINHGKLWRRRGHMLGISEPFVWHTLNPVADDPKQGDGGNGILWREIKKMHSKNRNYYFSNR